MLFIGNYFSKICYCFSVSYNNTWIMYKVTLQIQWYLIYDQRQRHFVNTWWWICSYFWILGLKFFIDEFIFSTVKTIHSSSKANVILSEYFCTLHLLGNIVICLSKIWILNVFCLKNIVSVSINIANGYS